MAAQGKDYDLARKIMSEVLQADADNPLAWLMMANVVESKKQARFCLERALTLDPGNEAALVRLDRLNQWEASTVIMAKPDPLRVSDPDDPESTAIERPTEGKAPEEIDWDKPLSDQILVGSDGGQADADSEGAAKDISRRARRDRRSREPRKPSRFSPLELLLIFFLVGAVCCVVTLVVSQLSGFDPLETLQGLTAAADEPVLESSTNVLTVVDEHYLALNAEDVNRVMATVHPSSPMYQTNRILWTALFGQFDLTTTVEGVELLTQSEQEAVVALTVTTQKLTGPSYQNNRINKLLTFRPDNGQWKLYAFEELETVLLP